tara:strand:- start:5119 stop:5799 length:681 start_codon:yes stop_codon:yes gene_type:complete
MAKFAKLIRKNNENLLIKNFIRHFKDILLLNNKNRFTFVLTGGKSPINLYRKLAKEKGVPWSKIDFFISDERYVKTKSKFSNINMCKKNLLNKINIQKKQIFQISTNNNSVKKDTRLYEKKIKKYFGNKKVVFDFCLLGMGPDGHIGGLFRNNIINKSKNNVSFLKRKDFTRISLTLKCINNSKIISLWLPNSKKIKIVKKILSDNKLKYPVSFLRKKNSFLFYCN